MYFLPDVERFADAEYAVPCPEVDEPVAARLDDRAVHDVGLLLGARQAAARRPSEGDVVLQGEEVLFVERDPVPSIEVGCGPDLDGVDDGAGPAHLPVGRGAEVDERPEGGQVGPGRLASAEAAELEGGGDGSVVAVPESREVGVARVFGGVEIEIEEVQVIVVVDVAAEQNAVGPCGTASGERSKLRQNGK